MLIGGSQGVIAVPLVCAFACQRGPAVAPTPPPSGTLTGTVMDVSGELLAGPVLVGLTDTKTSWQIAVVETDSKGRFAAQVPQGDYALAITTPRSFGFVDHVKAPGTGTGPKLSRECLPVRGRLAGAAAPSRVVFSRYSQLTGDRFVAPVSSDGGFQVCLPEADYLVVAEGASVSHAQAVHVPVSAPLELRVWPRATIESVPQVPGRAGPADLASFVKALAHGPRVLGLGEANHGTGDFYTRRGELTLALAREGEIRYVLFEADAIGMLAIDFEP